MVQRIWYYFLRTYVKVGLYFYFRKLVIEGKENIPDGPVIFASNHQNAFMDALLTICFTSKFTYSLTRADIFKKTFTRWLLTTLNMIPIFRIRDGRQSLAENQKTFEACDEVFLRNEAVLIFPEGNHGSQRRLRPLSKGFARIAFESLRQHPELRISIVPVGINYSNHQGFRSDVGIRYGKVLLANDYFHSTNSSDANPLRNDLADRLKGMITHIEDASRYDEIVKELEKTLPDYLHPTQVNERVATIIGGERPVVASTSEINSKATVRLLYYLNRLLNFPPLLIWAYIRNLIKDPVFITSLKFGIGIFLFPIYYLLVSILLFIWAGPWIAGGWWILCLSTTWFLRPD